MEDKSSAAAATSAATSDFTIARTLQTIQQLIDIFQFTPEQAEEAVNAVGPEDITLCCNYILDNGGEDKGGVIIPKTDCEHIKDHVRFDIGSFDFKFARCNFLKENDIKGGDSKGSFKIDTVDGNVCPSKENWLCLHCKAIRCSRYVNAHCEEHWRNTKASEIEATGDTTKAGHCISLSLNDLSVWCFECNAYLVNEDLTELVQNYERLKFGGDDGVCIEVDQKMNSFEGSKDSQAGNKRLKVEKNNADLDDSFIAGQISESCSQNNVSSESFVNKESDTKAPSTMCIEQDDSSYTSPSSQLDEDEDHNQNNDSPMDEFGDEESDISTNSMKDDCKDDEDLKNSNVYRVNSQSSQDSDTDENDQQNKAHPYLPSSLKDLAEFIQSDDCQSIVILAGAGMSRASGIPDFRSSGGLYETLEPDNLTATASQRDQIKEDPSFVFDKHLFLENCLPCLEVTRPFILGLKNTWKATLAHRFVELLHHKTGKLTRLYTQNIDGLERQCQKLPQELVIPVHGSMDRVACELQECQAEMDFEDFCEKVKTNIKDISGEDDSAPPTSLPIACEVCANFTVKPTVVLFHSPLPKMFFESIVKDLPSVDLFIVIGTSLTVGPANSLVYLVPDDCLRVIVNNEPVGSGLGIDYSDVATRDYFARGYSDQVLLDLSIEMGWTEELRNICEQLPHESKKMVKSRLEQVTT